MAYFDWNATAPLLPSARKAWLDVNDNVWGNPSAVYRAGAKSKVLLEESRESIAAGLKVPDSRIIFTSGATEANNAFIRLAAGKFPAGSKIWISSIEHPAVREPALHYWGHQRVVQIPVTRDGVVDLDWMESQLLENKPALICLMAVNNETGVIQPLEDVNRICESNEIPLFSDAVQWIGKVPGIFNPGPSLTGYCLSAHKFGGPKGTGCLVLGDAWGQAVLQFGGGQESGRRAGTEDLADIAAMAAALQQRLEQPRERLYESRDQFEEKLTQVWPEVIVHGKNSPRIWNTSLLSLPEFRSHRWIARLDKKGFQVSTGAACSAGKKGPSVVMQAMGVDDEAARRTLRISSGWDTSGEDWDALLSALIEVRGDLGNETSDNGPGRVIKL